MDVTVDVSQVQKLAVDLGRAGFKATLGARKILETHAFKVKQGMRKDFTGHRGFPGVPAKVNYTLQGLSAEIGVDKGGQGDLANILAFGTSRHPASVDHTAAQARELPRTLAEFEKLADLALP